jgi:hypothetical protein
VLQRIAISALAEVHKKLTDQHQLLYRGVWVSIEHAFDNLDVASRLFKPSS